MEDCNALQTGQPTTHRHPVGSFWHGNTCGIILLKHLLSDLSRPPASLVAGYGSSGKRRCTAARTLPHLHV